jgi:integrase
VPVYRLHDARHTSVTLMILRGVPLPVVSAWHGHASAAFTLTFYAHSQPDALTDAGETLAAAYGRSEGAVKLR